MLLQPLGGKVKKKKAVDKNKIDLLKVCWQVHVLFSMYRYGLWLK